MKMLKAISLCAALLTGAMTVSAVPMTANAIEYSGICGADMTYEFDGKDTLYFNGTGKMYDYGKDVDDNSAPWVMNAKLNSATKNVVIAEGITSVGSNAFCAGQTGNFQLPRSMYSLESIVFPESLETIGERAFFCCQHFNQIVIPKNVSYIGENAFFGAEMYDMYIYSYNCTIFDSDRTLSGISPSSDYKMTLHGYEGSTTQAYAEKYNYRFVPIDGVTDEGEKTPSEINGNCGDHATWTLDSDGTLTISGTDDLYNWDASSDSESPPWYNNRSDIKKVILSEGITSIGNSAFYGCSNLESITIPDGVTRIGSDAFTYCVGLKSVVLPESVESISSYAFFVCGIGPIIIKNPNCEIYESRETICNICDGFPDFSGAIIGYDNSTAEAYAKKVGYYFINIDQFNNLSESMRGDIDNDSEISVTDAQIVLLAAVQISIGKEPELSADQMEAADVDKDGGISITDAQIILNYYVQNTILGANVDWDTLMQ